MKDKTLIITLLLLSSLGIYAQKGADTTSVLHFVSGKDMFFVPYKENAPELERIRTRIKQHYSQLRAGQLYICVSSYAASSAPGITADRMAYLRNNRVKSELILHYRVTEQMFVTDRRIPEAYGKEQLHDVVVVTLPASAEKVESIAGPAAAAKVRSYYHEVAEVRLKAERQLEHERQQERERQAAAAREHDRREQQRRAADRAEAEMNRRLAERERLRADSIRRAGQPSSISSSLSLHFNLLRWATLTPDLGIEYRIPRSRLGILAGGSWTSWSRDNRNRRYALWRVSPELRYYLGKRQSGYLGAMYHLGGFNYKPGDTGKQGDYRGGGITGGYRLMLNRTLSLDFHAALGYTRADYDKYTVTDGVRIRRGSEVKNYWGVNRLGVMLVWKPF